MPNPVDVFNKRLDKHTIDRLRAEDRAALRLYRLLEESRREMYSRLLLFESEWGSNERFTPGFLRAAIGDIGLTLAKLASSATESLRREMLAGFNAGQEQTYDELRVFERDLGFFKPAAPTETVLRLIRARTDNLRELFTAVHTRIVGSIDRTARAAGADAEALAAAGRGTEAVKDALSRGILQGEGTASIARRLMAPDGEFPAMSRNAANRIVRIAINESYNDGHDETIREASTRMRGLGRRWLSALVRSTPICIDLHGSIASVGEPFRFDSIVIDRPPAIGGNLTPRFHLCRSRVIPYSAKWPPNAKLAPLTDEEKAHYKGGGGFTARDIARPKLPNGFVAATPGAREILERRNRDTQAAADRANAILERKDEAARKRAAKAKAKKKKEREEGS